MSFTQTHIVSVNPPLLRGRDLLLGWTVDAPPLPTQVYVNKQLLYAGTAASCVIPLPPEDEAPLRIDIGTVDPDELHTDFSSVLPAAPNRRVTLEWQGGTFEATDIAGFHVYGESTPGGGVNYTTPIGTVVAYPSGIVLDGFGLGGFGDGGWGEAASYYTWQSKALASGTWTFAVVPFNAAGVEGDGRTTTATIAAPPREPPVFPGTNVRLKYTVADFGTIGFGEGLFGLSGTGRAQVQLNWLPSTG